MVNTNDVERGILRAKKILNSDDLARWAKSRGLLGVYIKFRPKTTYLKAAWQVVSISGKTDPDAIAVNQGRKTFTYDNLSGKHAAQNRAMEWCDHAFAGGSPIRWFKIEGFGPDWFPKSVVDELKTFLPELMVYSKESSAKAKKRRKVSKV